MQKRKHAFWGWGQKSRLAKLAGIRPSHLHEILTCDPSRRISYDMAKRLERSSIAVLPEPIYAIAWLERNFIDHPAFTKQK